jgi:DNA-binding IclR family transcriptional regulator
MPALPRLTRLATRTVTSKADFERELGRIRHVGYAVAVDELEPGLVAMAAPIRNHLGYVVAALSLNGPGTRLGSKRRRALLPKLCGAANRVSRRLGASVRTAGFTSKSRVIS